MIAAPCSAGSCMQPVDLALGADVDAARRLAEHEHVDAEREDAPEDDLLLVAARERGDRLPRRRCSRRSARSPRGPRTLRTGVEHARVREAPDPGHGEVLGHAPGRQQRGALAVVGHEADPASQGPSAGRRADRLAGDPDAARAGMAPPSAMPSSALPEPDESGDAEDLAAADLSDVGCSARRAWQPVDLEHHLAWPIRACRSSRRGPGRPSSTRARSRASRAAARRRRAPVAQHGRARARPRRARASGGRSSAPPRPRARCSSTTSSSRWVAASDSELVASSRISSRAREETARAISTSCCSSTLRSPTGVARSTCTSRRSAPRAASAAQRPSRRGRTPARQAAEEDVLRDASASGPASALG